MTDARELTTRALIDAGKALAGYHSGAYPSTDELDRVIAEIEAALQSNLLAQAET